MDLDSQLARVFEQELVELGALDVPGVVLDAVEVRPAPGRFREEKRPRPAVGAPDVGGAALAQEARLFDFLEHPGVLQNAIHFEHQRLADMVARECVALDQRHAHGRGVALQQSGTERPGRPAPDHDDVESCGHSGAFWKVLQP